MLKLNILPESFKKEVRLFSIYNVFRNIILLLVFLTATVGIISLLGDAVLQVYIDSDIRTVLLQALEDR